MADDPSALPALDQRQVSARCDDRAPRYRSRNAPSERHGLDSIAIGEGLRHAAQFKKLYPKCRKGLTCARGSLFGTSDTILRFRRQLFPARVKRRLKV
jgi:hypothetical protein